MPELTIEVVTRHNLRGIELPGFTPITGTFFTIWRGKVSAQELKEILTRLETAEQNGDIISYFYQEETR